MTIIKKFEPEEPKKRFSIKYLILIGGSLLVLMLAQVFVNNSVAVYGDKLQRLSALSKSLNLENQILENEIAKQKSLSSIASKSAELGFSKPESIQYIR